jgi:hypothetical protein
VVPETRTNGMPRRSVKNELCIAVTKAKIKGFRAVCPDILVCGSIKE